MANGKRRTKSPRDFQPRLPMGLRLPTPLDGVGAWHPGVLAPRHLALLNRQLVRVASGSVRRLMVTMPPRHGKSLLTSMLFPTWYLGMKPQGKLLLASYGGDFAATWGRRVRDAFAGAAGREFPARLRRDSRAAERWELVRGGSMATAGVGGSLTGRGAEVLIVDDPVKNAEEADSARQREKVWDWYRSVAATRLEPGGRVVLVQTRWHWDDLAGRLLANDDGEPWTAVNLPALAEDADLLGRPPGAALWPERFSVAELERIRRAVGPRWWSALYQQRPAPDCGQDFDRQWFRYFRTEGDLHLLGAGPVADAECERFATVDLAISERQAADWTVAMAWAVTPGHHLLLLEVLRARLGPAKLAPTLAAFAARNGAEFVGVEQVGFQEAIIQQLRDAGLAVRGLKPKGDKRSRAVAASVRMEAGMVHFRAGAAWLSELESELLAFPLGKHDDQVDALVYACLHVGRRRGPPDAAAPE